MVQYSMYGLLHNNIGCPMMFVFINNFFILNNFEIMVLQIITGF